ncbi:hypothetical protein S7711_02467 [Stachybotrys chartarum IBT 7711]|uniref:Molybdopterin synthase sulfur carrier subunit n=1 Tax=Stachybotrys chartarum (strain CBS 109288 / IBT 7711) TaxID=1280523 RepID=A0A084AQH3_STACB|nr:hypothetical protein S7711_02467 [Stachybotrys chartarum IBT 7711]
MSSVPKPPPGHFAVLYFASAGSHTGKEHEALPAPLPLSKLFAELDARYPGFTGKILDSCLVTVNLDYVDVGGDGDKMIQEGDEVAIIPPVSSGPPVPVAAAPAPGLAREVPPQPNDAHADKPDQQNAHNGGEDGDDGSQARDGRNLAPKRLRADLPPLGPVRANILVIGRRHEWDLVRVGHAGPRLWQWHPSLWLLSSRGNPAVSSIAQDGPVGLRRR